MLDGMNSNVTNIADKLEILETRVQALEQNEQIRESTVKNLKLKCDKMEELSTRVVNIEERCVQKKDPQTTTFVENFDIAIYGLITHDDVMDSVNQLFVDMNLQNIQCRYAFRTPSRSEISRPGVVIAELMCLSDKRIILERKRFIRPMPQYRDVFIK